MVTHQKPVLYDNGGRRFHVVQDSLDRDRNRPGVFALEQDHVALVKALSLLLVDRRQLALRIQCVYD